MTEGSAPPLSILGNNLTIPREGLYAAVVNGMGLGFVWRTGTRRNDDVAQLALAGDDTTSTEEVFAPVERDMETVAALFGMPGAP